MLWFLFTHIFMYPHICCLICIVGNHTDEFRCLKIHCNSLKPSYPFYIVLFRLPFLSKRLLHLMFHILSIYKSHYDRSGLYNIHPSRERERKPKYQPLRATDRTNQNIQHSSQFIIWSSPVLSLSPSLPLPSLSNFVLTLETFTSIGWQPGACALTMDACLGSLELGVGLGMVEGT